MKKRQKVNHFAMELTANGSVALGTSGLEQVSDNWDQDSVMRISKGKVPTKWFYWLDIGRGMVLASLFVFVNCGCTSQRERMKLIVWEGVGEKIIHVSCDVDNEEVMLEVVLQDQKGSLVSNIKSNIIYLRKGKKMYMPLRACYSGLGKCKDYVGDWDKYQRLSCDSC
jgi:hypothetical protein